ncbi:hypothetical protein BJV82DRAFT_630216 [Fennellomyces sp. T-0311]|nr:hypothetical protein BJV82DRAFT_630216 [Fennellomyces sp. T-0311]
MLSQHTEAMTSTVQSIINGNSSTKKLSRRRTDSAYAGKRTDPDCIDNAFQLAQYIPHLADVYVVIDTTVYPFREKTHTAIPSTRQQPKKNLHVTSPNALKETDDRLFTKLNFDILECIFQHLGQRDLLRCASVNRQWSWFLLGWPYFWNTIRTNASRKHVQLFESVLYRKQINELILRGSSKYHQEFADAFLDLMADTHYSQLMSMHIEAMQQVNPHTLSRVLNTSSSNLTTLYLSRCAITPEVVFSSVLNHCPLLVKLYYKQHKGTKRGSWYHRHQTSTSQRKRLALRELVIDLGNEYQQSNTFLPDILKKCTHLQLLLWNPVDHVNHDSIFRSLNIHCPHLQWLSIVKKEDQEDMNDFVNFRKHYLPPKSGQSHRGLTLLDISHNGIGLEASTLENLLRIHHSTLRVIALPDVKSRFFQQALAAMQKYPLVNIDRATLGSVSNCFTNIDNHTQSMLFALVSGWTKLRTISLSYYNSNALGILNALVHLKELETIRLSKCSSESIYAVASALRAWMTDKSKVVNIKELSLDCQVLQYINPEYIITGFFGLINVHVIHASESTMTAPCTCQYSSVMYKLINARKVLNRRGGDIYVSIAD